MPEHNESYNSEEGAPFKSLSKACQGLGLKRNGRRGIKDKKDLESVLDEMIE